MTQPDFSFLLEDVIALMRGAGQVICNHDATRHTPHLKTDGSRVTDADRFAEEFIRAGIKKLTPDIPFVAEESCEAGNRPDISGGTYWVCDPLDGTQSFIDGSPMFTTQIALIQNFQPTLGVFYFPKRDILCAAAGAGTAFCQPAHNEARQNLTARVVRTQNPVVLLFNRRAMDDQRVQDFLKTLDNPEVQFLSGSEKLYQLAAGQADFYPRVHTHYEWDVAPGHALLIAAGGSIVTLDGKPYIYGAADYRSTPFIARGRTR